MDERTFTLNISISTAGHTLQIAEELLSLAESNAEMECYLAGCSIIMQVAALQQAMESLIFSLSTNYATAYELRRENVPFYQKFFSSRTLTLRDKMFYVPRLLSAGEYALDRKSPIVQDLDQLIRLRNRMVHVSDYHRTVTRDNPQDVTMEVTDTKVSVSVPIPETPWDSVTAARAGKLCESASAVIHAVLFVDVEDEEMILVKKGTTDKTYAEIVGFVHSGQADLETLERI